MAKKTNKTSHLLNLLTNNAAPEEQETASSVQETAAEAPVQTAHPASPTKVTVVDEGSLNDRLSQEILSKLSQELESAADTAQAAPESQAAASAPQAVPTAQNIAPAPQASVSPADSAVQSAQTAQTAAQPQIQIAPQTAEQKLASAPADPVSAPKFGGRLSDQLHDVDESFHFINVMEELIMQHDLDMILRQYNVCTCTRCKADVCALTLTGLPAKYVVASDHSLSPILNYYKNRYRISILAELSKACNAVREHPHHQR